MNQMLSAGDRLCPDLFMEALYPQRMGTGDYIRAGAAAVLTLLLMAAGAVFWPLTVRLLPALPVFAAAWLLLLYGVSLSCRREVELVLTNDQLDIDVIYGRRRRRRRLSLDLNQISGFAALSGPAAYPALTAGCTRMDYAASPGDPGNVVLLWNGDGARRSVRFTPPEPFLARLMPLVRRHCRSGIEEIEVRLVP